MRFKIDENLPLEAAALLQGAGADVLTVADQNLIGGADAQLAAVCRREGRVLLTLDLDFADLRAYPPEILPGLIVIRAASQAKPHVLALVSQVIGHLQHETVAGRLWIVDESGIRIRGQQ